VLEETGYDIKDWLREEDFVEVTLGDQDTKLFIIQVRQMGPAGRALQPGGLLDAVYESVGVSSGEHFAVRSSFMHNRPCWA
jgi:hypothetical protein